LNDYIVMTAELPKMFASAEDEASYLAISEQMQTIKLAAFYIPVLLCLVYRFPMYMVWMMSNLLQILEIIGYLRIQLPGNATNAISGLQDFI
jgi:hypothetical protein